MSSFSSRSQRSSTSISPFRTRKSPKSAGGGGGGRPTTPTGQRLPRPAVSPTSTASSAFDRPDLSIPKENVAVTVRFRPLRSGHSPPFPFFFFFFFFLFFRVVSCCLVLVLARLRKGTGLLGMLTVTTPFATSTTLLLPMGLVTAFFSSCFFL